MKVSSLKSLCLDSIIENLNYDDMEYINNFSMPIQISRPLKCLLNLQDMLHLPLKFMLTNYKFHKKEDILLSGNIQSGKTNQMLIYCWWSIFIARRQVVFVVRNIKADKLQLLERIKIFNKTFIKNKKYYINVINNSCKNPGIIISLANYQQIKTLLLFNIHKRKYNLCIDEADICVKSKDNTSKLESFFVKLENNAKHILRVTATDFAVIVGKINSITKIIKLDKPKNYIGIKDINIKIIDKKIIENDDYIIILYKELLKKDRFFILHSASKYKSDHLNYFNIITKNFKNITTIIYNGDGITLKPGEHTDIQKKWLSKYNIDKEFYVFRKSVKISDVLQLVKHHKYIVVISGHLASRGVSFVSTDYSLHLTDQLYIPSPTTHGEGLLQGLRLLGCYNDKIIPTLWCSSKTKERILRFYNITNSITNSLKDTTNLKESIKNLDIKRPSGIPFTRSKVSQIYKIKSKSTGVINIEINNEQE